MTQLLDLLSLPDYIKRFRGASIRDCAVIDRGLFYFVCLQDWPDDLPAPFDEELETRLTKLELQVERRWVTTRTSGYSNLMCCGPREGDLVCVAVDGRGQVFGKRLEGSSDEVDIPGAKGQGPNRGWRRDPDQARCRTLVWMWRLSNCIPTRGAE